jgi:pectate lyase
LCESVSKKRISIAACMVAFLMLFQQALAFEETPIGYASMAGDPAVPATYLAGGTTGGAGGTVVTVTTAAQFGTYARKDTPYIIQVQGDIGDTGQINMHSNKTVIGIGTNPTIHGNLVVSGTSNFIIRNLIVRNDTAGSSADGIAVRDNGHHVWIDHCEVFNIPDGECDITNAADYVTVSWCKFYYTTDWSIDHRLSSLVGNSDTSTTDLGRLHITYHHNWWAERVQERMPSVRYGRVHLFNNYYTSTGNNYCIRYRIASEVIVENNYFNGVKDPHALYISGDEPPGYPQGLCYAFGNIYHNTLGTYNSTGPLALPTYSWSASSAEDVPAIVTTGAGVNKIYGDPDTTPPTPSPMTWTTLPSGANSTSITMVASTATDASGVEYFFDCTVGGGHDSAWQNSTTYTDTGLTQGVTYSYQVKARDKSANHNETGFSSVASASPVADTMAPTPNPMTWSVAPHGASLHSISMTAMTATDESGVQYYFTCTSGGGHDSGWQNGITYVDEGLAEGATCSYTVKARDYSPAHNETSPSAPDASASAMADTAAPAPNPMTWSAVPAATGISAITMTASTATDVSGVEYYFANTTDASHDSGWQDDMIYTDTGLLNGVTYAYRVIARDKSLAKNETAWSEPNSATTVSWLCTSPVAHDLNNDCRVDFLDYALLTSHWSEVLPLTVDIIANGTFDAGVVPWQTISLPGATGYFIAWPDDTTGNPVGSVVVGSDADPDGTNGSWFYQAIPVIPGNQYKLQGQWMGDLSGYLAGDPCNRGNWAEVMVAFESVADPNTWTSWSDPSTVMFRKSSGSIAQNTGPSGAWDWEQFTTSPANGPVDGIFTATGNRMVVGFSVGGLPASGVAFCYVDNVRVLASPCPSDDANGDCLLDLKDIAAFAEQWLACSRDPVAECWQ